MEQTSSRRRVRFEDEMFEESDMYDCFEALYSGDMEEIHRLKHEYPSIFTYSICNSTFSIQPNGDNPRTRTASFLEAVIQVCSLPVIDFVLQECQEYVNKAPPNSLALPIHFACRYRDVDVVKRLVEFHGARLDIGIGDSGLTPVLVACKFNQHEILDYLLTSTRVNAFAVDNKQRTCLHHCVIDAKRQDAAEIAEDQAKTVEVWIRFLKREKIHLTRANSRVDSQLINSLGYAKAAKEHIGRKMYKALIRECRNQPVVADSADNVEAPSYEKCSKILKEKSRMYEAKNHILRMIEHGISNDISAMDIISAVDRTPVLHLAVSSPFFPYPCFPILLDHPSCDLDERLWDTGETVLHVAARGLNIPAARILLAQRDKKRSGAPIMSLVDNRGNTPLHSVIEAVIRPSTESQSSIGDMLTILKLLLPRTKGVTEVMNHYHMTPLILAASHEPHESFACHSSHDVSSDAVMLSALYELIQHTVGLTGVVSVQKNDARHNKVNDKPHDGKKRAASADMPANLVHKKATVSNPDGSYVVVPLRNLRIISKDYGLIPLEHVQRD